MLSEVEYGTQVLYSLFLAIAACSTVNDIQESLLLYTTPTFFTYEAFIFQVTCVYTLITGNPNTLFIFVLALMVYVKSTHTTLLQLVKLNKIIKFPIIYIPKEAQEKCQTLPRSASTRRLTLAAMQEEMRSLEGYP